MNWALLVGSLIGVLALAGAAHWLGLGGDARLDETTARELVEEQGFAIATLTVADDGLSAVSTDAQGRTMRVRRHGAHFLAHRTI